VKILDFGLAKLQVPVAADVRRLTSKSRRSEPPHVGCYEAEEVAPTIRIDAPFRIKASAPAGAAATLRVALCS